MKTYCFITFIVLSVTLFADPGSKDKKNKVTTEFSKNADGLKEQIADNVSLPQQLADYDYFFEVDVSFLLSEENTINVVETTSDDPGINSHIKQQLEEMQLFGSFDAMKKDVPYLITLRFKRM